MKQVENGQSVKTPRKEALFLYNNPMSARQQKVSVCSVKVKLSLRWNLERLFIHKIETRKPICRHLSFSREKRVRFYRVKNKILRQSAVKGKFLKGRQHLAVVGWLQGAKWAVWRYFKRGLFSGMGWGFSAVSCFLEHCRSLEGLNFVCVQSHPVSIIFAQ